jgi:preprotein translocase subunit SecG
MSLTYTILLVLFLLVAIFLVVLILVQQGKGAGMGASFGAGASNTLFGSAGSTNFLTKSTWFLTILFFVLSVVLGFLNTHKTNKPEGFSQIETSVE